jgi:transcriptional regulator with XRE-family HTH domain
MRQELSEESVASRTFEEEYLYGEATDTVEALMSSLGLSQAELAERLGVSRGRMSQILSGRENLTLRSLAALGWALGVRFELFPTALPDRAVTPAASDPPLPQWLRRLLTRPVPQYRSMAGKSIPLPAWRGSTFTARGGEVELATAS